MRARRYVAGVAALALAGGCATTEKVRVQVAAQPKVQVREAALQLAAVKRGGFTVSFVGDVNELITADTDAEEAAVVRTVANSTLTFGYDDDRYRLAATIDGVTGTEIRVVGNTLYAKAPVAALAKKFGAGADDVKEMEADPDFGPLANGEWVSIDVAKAAQDLPTQDVDPAKAMAELKKSATNLLQGASVVRDAADPKHLTVTSSTTKAYAEAQRFVKAAGGKEGAELFPAEDAPADKPVVLDLWIDQHRLTAVEVNLLQFMDGKNTKGKKAAVRLDLTAGQAISAPAGAIKLDPSLLTGLESGLPK